ncbi:MAG: ABC transporter permease, partial [Betaproteobacteria bacterium]
MAALVAKEFLQLRRDPRTLALMIFMPVLLMTMFGYAASFDVKHVATELVGNDSAVFRRALNASDAFAVRDAIAPDVAAARDDIQHDRVLVAIVVDQTGQPTSVLIDGSRLLEAMTVERNLAALTVAAGVRAPVRLDVLYNPSLTSAPYMVPGLIGQIMVQVGVVLTALGIVRERERGTIEQLMITPISRLEL